MAHARRWYLQHLESCCLRGADHQDFFACTSPFIFGSDLFPDDASAVGFGAALLPSLFMAAAGAGFASCDFGLHRQAQRHAYDVCMHEPATTRMTEQAWSIAVRSMSFNGKCVDVLTSTRLTPGVWRC